ncbi:MAG: hypothetical protein MJ093_08760 [Saccharofermentans sp.]|nr:hypothetical protein [Saccharofermentans sp.]
MKKTLIKGVALTMSATMVFSAVGCAEKTTEKASGETTIETMNEATTESTPQTERQRNTENTDAPMETKEARETEGQPITIDERQMDIIISNRATWDYSMNGIEREGRYAITDLDDDGNYELMTSVDHGQLLNTDSSMYEVDLENNQLVLVGEWSWNGDSEDNVELDWSTVNDWVIIDGNYVYAIHNYTELGSNEFIDKVYHVTFTGDDIEDINNLNVELKAIKTTNKGETTYVDNEGNIKTSDYFESVSLRWNLQYYDECDASHIDWASWAGEYDYSDEDVYDMLVTSWQYFDLYYSCG